MSSSVRSYLPHFALLTAQLCFSGWHIIGSLALKKGADPFVFVLYRELLASAVMYLLILYRKQIIFIHRVDYLRFFFVGCCSFVNVVGAMLALQYISATRFAIFQPAIPCIATVVSIVVGSDMFTFIKLIGILIAVGGAVLAEAWNESSTSGDEKNIALGTVIVSIQVFGMALLVVFVKPLLAKYPPACVTLVYYSIGTMLTILLCAIWSFQFTVADLYFSGHTLPWVGLFYAALVATAFTYNALSWSGKRLSPATVTIYCTFQPVGTILLSYGILGAVVTLPEGLGATAVIIGLLLTVYGSRLSGDDSAAINSQLVIAKGLSRRSDEESDEADELDEDVASILAPNTFGGSNLYTKLHDGSN